jgi:uncharacterized protein (DUF1501 family)
MFTRRKFLKRSSLLSLTPLVPAFLTKTAGAAEAKSNDRILVVIQLSGGNDGLNTVIPFADENYARYREQLRIPEADVIKLNDSLGLHPGMKAFGELFDDERAAIIPGVGYPNPNRSHFRSMAIWHSARLRADEHTGQGWLGRAMDRSRNETSTAPDSVFVGDGDIPSAIVGRRSQPIALNNEEELILSAGLPQLGRRPSDNDLDAFLQQTVDSSFTAARQVAEAAKNESADLAGFPNSRLGRKLKLTAKMIRMETGTRVFYLSQGGYDTHSAQAGTHRSLLREFSTSLKAFLDDMKTAGLGEQVIVLSFSEFGRRVQENASAGTDHGTAGPVFVAGESVQAGMLAEYPSLEELEDGDLKSTVDFRQIYASILTNWLQIDRSAPLGGEFIPLRVTKS